MNEIIKGIVRLLQLDKLEISRESYIRCAFCVWPTKESEMYSRAYPEYFIIIDITVDEGYLSDHCKS